ncbi:MAG: hypothetical protein GXX94_10425 [Chloroflexi bacterium]|nr:hypothetical protein [Chloroflexota bacterium]
MAEDRGRSSRMGIHGMDNQLQGLRRWAGRRAMPRLYTELALHLAGEGYELELEGEVLSIFGLRRPKGPLGRLRRARRECLLRLVRQDDGVSIPEDAADPSFVAELLERLRV